jgi:uncharacterized protein (DUF433 family)
MARVPQARTAPFGAIIRDPRVCGGDPTIAGTRIPVQSVVVSYQIYGDIEKVRHAYPRLDLTDIQAALAYYDGHRDEIDRLIAENEQAIEAPE